MPTTYDCARSGSKALAIRVLMVLALLAFRASLIALDANATTASSRVGVHATAEFLGSDFVRGRVSLLDVAHSPASHPACSAPAVTISMPRPGTILQPRVTTASIAIAQLSLAGRDPPL